MTSNNTNDHAAPKVQQQNIFAGSPGLRAPKNLQQGLSSGVSQIVAGAIGAAGVAVVAPVAGLSIGLARGGLIGGAVGATGGAVVGVVGAAALAVNGAVSGVVQVAKGVAAVPQSIVAPKQGKWWNEAEKGGSWVRTDMTEEAKHLEGVPEDGKR
jgi:hypothetical protein